MIEIAPEEYHKKLSWNEAMLYCFSLNINGKIGWRIPSYSVFRGIPETFGRRVLGTRDNRE
jgi:hypothetical protein